MLGMTVPAELDSTAPTMSPMRLPSWRSRRPTARRRPHSRCTLAGLPAPPATRHAATEGTLPAPTGARRAFRRLLPHRAGRRLGRRGDRDACRACRQQVFLNGAKQFITSGRSADVALVFAVTDPAAGKQGISAFIVPTGFQATPWRASSTRWASVHPIIATSCSTIATFCPTRCWVRKGKASKSPSATSRGAVFGVAAQSVGMARVPRCRPRLRARAPHLRQGDHRASGGLLPPGRHGDVAAGGRADGAEHHVYTTRGRPCLKEASMAKLFASEVAEKVCSAAGHPDPRRLRLSQRLPRRAHLSRRARHHDL